MMGGGLRQTGVLAAPGIFALKHLTNRIGEDHKNAKYLGERLSTIHGIIVDKDKLDINMVFFDISENLIAGANANAKVITFPRRASDPGSTAPLAEYDLEQEAFLIEIVPVRYEVIEGKSRLVSCSDSKITEKINC